MFCVPVLPHWRRFGPLYHSSFFSPSFSSRRLIWKIMVENCARFYFKPAKIFMSDVLPAPEGPRIAVSWPDLKAPFILCKIILPVLPKRNWSSRYVNFSSAYAVHIALRNSWLSARRQIPTKKTHKSMDIFVARRGESFLKIGDRCFWRFLPFPLLKQRSWKVRSNEAVIWLFPWSFVSFEQRNPCSSILSLRVRTERASWRYAQRQLDNF